MATTDVHPKVAAAGRGEPARKPAGHPLMMLREVSMAFARPSGGPLPVLSKINLTVRQGEILGLLGRSGSGKSTLLRIAAGLVKPTSGEVVYRDRPLSGPSEGIALVFQTFALYPWLTVLKNVELGLDASGLSLEETRRRAMSAIDLIGLDGFQSAYPRELSGGMRQRVGFARALVGDPVLLLMDEPFSALDVLTAETLRTDFMDLWLEQELSTQGVLLVTHNIEEAVLMCDRILVLAANPGHIAAEVAVPLAHPRNRLDPSFRDVVDNIYSILTARLSQSQTLGGRAAALPRVSTNRLLGFLERFGSPPLNGDAELALVGQRLALPTSALLPLASALHLLAFAELKEGRLKLTAAGGVMSRADREQRKRLFREHLLRFVPLAAHIRQVLEERESHEAPRERFELELLDHLTPPEAEHTLRTAIAWSRYAEAFDYDDRSRKFRLRGS
jgi:NitT/TauT family transport system ATP-binding protein